ncbi:YihY/virulence factor BrkB family protein, partial [Streptomyces beijiangensis]|nr:YihY/virulence factor BrkB family protein [Streptomyces beijiangensis]
AVLVGAAVNAAIDRVWPAAATAAARAANERVRAAHTTRLPARPTYRPDVGAAEDPDGEGEDDGEDDSADMPSEFPERWSRFLPPDDVTSRLRGTGRDKEQKP